MSTGEDPLRLGETMPGLSARVLEVLREEILSGRWPVGTKIPTETALVAWTGAGRNTVREAVGSLVEVGMLSRQQGRGTFVSSRSDLERTLSRHAAANPRRDTLELRLALDTAAARLAARRRTQADIEDLRLLLAARDDAWRDGTQAARKETDTALHVSIVHASHNTLLAQVYAGLLGVFDEALDHDAAESGDALGPAHRLLVQAVIDGDEPNAAAQMHTLLEPLIEQVGQPGSQPSSGDQAVRETRAERHLAGPPTTTADTSPLR